MAKRLKIAMLGIKGIPAKWGGMEKYVEEIGRRLVQRGHEVTVFGSKWYCMASNGGGHLGMKIKSIPTLHSQATDAVSNAFVSSLLVILGHYDIVHFHGYASYYFVPLLKTFGKKCLITAHGAESGWDNPKYGKFARALIRAAYLIGLRQAHIVTTVAWHLSERIRQMAQISAEVVPSGLDDVNNKVPHLIKDSYGLKGLDYFLFLGRIDPIKRVDWLLDLMDLADKRLKLVIAGGSQDSSTDAYYQGLIQRALGKSWIIFTGPVAGDLKAELLGNCLCVLAPSQYEGLPITVLEAAAYGRCCLASDIPAHREIIEDGVNGFLFPVDSRTQFLKSFKKISLLSAESLLAIGCEARKRAMSRFNWDKTTERIELLYRSLLDGKDKEQ